MEPIKYNCHELAVKTARRVREDAYYANTYSTESDFDEDQATSVIEDAIVQALMGLLTRPR